MSPDTPRHILVLRFSALGDVAMTVPVVTALAKAYPDTRITLLTSPQGAEIYRAVCDETGNLTVQGVDVRHEYHSLWSMMHLHRQLQPWHIDAVADLHDVLRTKGLRTLFRLDGIPVAVIDKGRQEKRDLVSHSIHRRLPTGFERYQKVFQQLGFDFPVTYDSAAAPCREEGRRLVAQWTADGTLPTLYNNKGGIGVGIAPFSRHVGKVYPADLMEEVMERLLAADARIHLFLFGSPAERTTLDEWAGRHSRTTCVAGRGTVATDLALMSALSAMVAMDSANMHLAALVHTPVISIWGATHPWAGFLGWDMTDADVVQANMDCRPCSIYGNKPCRFGTYECLRSIAPAAVAARVLSRLEIPQPTSDER